MTEFEVCCVRMVSENVISVLLKIEEKDSNNKEMSEFKRKTTLMFAIGNDIIAPDKENILKKLDAKLVVEETEDYYFTYVNIPTYEVKEYERVTYSSHPDIWRYGTSYGFIGRWSGFIREAQRTPKIRKFSTFDKSEFIRKESDVIEAICMKMPGHDIAVLMEVSGKNVKSKATFKIVDNDGKNITGYKHKTIVFEECGHQFKYKLIDGRILNSLKWHDQIQYKIDVDPGIGYSFKGSNRVAVRYLFENDPKISIFRHSEPKKKIKKKTENEKKPEK